MNLLNARHSLDDTHIIITCVFVLESHVILLWGIITTKYFFLQLFARTDCMML